MTSNTSPSRITAAAGTGLAGASFSNTVIIFFDERALQHLRCHHSRGIAGSGFRPLSNIPHCSLQLEFGPFSVPMWLIYLSNQLRIIGLVSHYLTNYLILRELI
jgi:hypothetical protein